MSKKPSKHKPAKPARVKRPKGIVQVYGRAIVVSSKYPVWCLSTFKARKLAGRLMNAAAWIEQQNGGKRGH